MKENLGQIHHCSAFFHLQKQPWSQTHQMPGFDPASLGIGVFARCPGYSISQTIRSASRRELELQGRDNLTLLHSGHHVQYIFPPLSQKQKKSTWHCQGLCSLWGGTLWGWGSGRMLSWKKLGWSSGTDGSKEIWQLSWTQHCYLPHKAFWPFFLLILLFITVTSKDD